MGCLNNHTTEDVSANRVMKSCKQKEKGLQLYDLYLTAEPEYILCSKQFKYLTKPDQVIGFGDKVKRNKKNAIMLDIGRWIKHIFLFA